MLEGALSSRTGSDVARSARPWLVALARMGYVAQAVVYVTIGIAALRASADGTSAVADAAGAMHQIATHSFGTITLLIVAIGAFGYAIWQLVAAITDAAGEGRDWKGLIARAGRVLTAIGYVLLGIAAIRFDAHPLSEAGGDAVRGYVQTVITAPLGRVLLALIGVGVVVYAVYEFRCAFRHDVCERLDLSRLGETARGAMLAVGRAGTATHGMLFGVIGALFFRAALRHEPSAAGGVATALKTVERGSHGDAMLAAIAVGLVAYGTFQLINARYRRVEVP